MTLQTQTLHTEIASLKAEIRDIEHYHACNRGGPEALWCVCGYCARRRQKEPPPPHPVSGAVHAWNDGRLIVLVVFARIGSWAITQCAHAGRESAPAVEPCMGMPAVTWLGEDHNYGRKLGHFIGYSDQETEILELLQHFDPAELRRAFPEGPPLRSEMGFIDTEVIQAGLERRQMLGGVR